MNSYRYTEFEEMENDPSYEAWANQQEQEDQQQQDEEEASRPV